MGLRQLAEAGTKMAEKLHTLEEASALLHQKPSTIRSYIRDGKLTGTPIGKNWFVMDSDLQTFMEQQRAGGDAEIARRKEKAQRAAKTREENKREQDAGASQASE